MNQTASTAPSTGWPVLSVMTTVTRLRPTDGVVGETCNVTTTSLAELLPRPAHPATRRAATRLARTSLPTVSLFILRLHDARKEAGKTDKRPDVDHHAHNDQQCTGGEVDRTEVAVHPP